MTSLIQIFPVFVSRSMANRAGSCAAATLGARSRHVATELSKSLRVRGWLMLFTLCLATLVSGCDQLGIETPQKTLERQLAEAKAIGGACRHALRAIEDCYNLNLKADKSSVFTGWREMDEYMRENKLEGVVPVVPRPAARAASAAASKADEEADEAAVDEPALKKGRTRASPQGH